MDYLTDNSGIASVADEDRFPREAAGAMPPSDPDRCPPEPARPLPPANASGEPPANPAARGGEPVRSLSSETSSVPNAMLQEDFGKALSDLMTPTRFRFLTDAPPPSRLDLMKSGPLSMAESRAGSFAVSADPADLHRARDGLVLHVGMTGQYNFDQNGRQSEIAVGDVGFAHPGLDLQVASPGYQVCRLVFIPAEELAPHVGDVSRFAGMVMKSHETEAALLTQYLGHLDFASLIGQPALGAMISRQVAEIAGAGLARLEGRAASTDMHAAKAMRLAEIKRLVGRRLGDPLLNAERVGRALGVSARYVQKLMDEDGTTFSAYVAEKRLTLAFKLLSEASPLGPTVRQIAEQAGFTDPSHFSRAFRRRFGETPASFRGLGVGG